jgi:hypothetical protein
MAANKVEYLSKTKIGDVELGIGDYVKSNRGCLRAPHHIDTGKIWKIKKYANNEIEIIVKCFDKGTKVFNDISSFTSSIYKPEDLIPAPPPSLAPTPAVTTGGIPAGAAAKGSASGPTPQGKRITIVAKTLKAKSQTIRSFIKKSGKNISYFFFSGACS